MTSCKHPFRLAAEMLHLTRLLEPPLQSQYLCVLEAAVEAEKPYADEFVVHENEEDDGRTGRERWEEWYNLYNERFMSDRPINPEHEFGAWCSPEGDEHRDAWLGMDHSTLERGQFGRFQDAQGHAPEDYQPRLVEERHHEDGAQTDQAAFGGTGEGSGKRRAMDGQKDGTREPSR